MISSKGLFEELLPNVYIKSLDLNSNYKPKQTNKKVGYYSADQTSEKVATLGDTASSEIVLSTKFAKNSNLMSDISLLLESGLSDYFKVYAHQITDKQTYLNLIKTANKDVLTSNNSNLDFITTTIVPYYGNQIESPEDASEQILEDGTILSEKITNLSFDFPKDTDFLAYIVVVGINHENTDEIYTSKALKELIILDGEFQNRGLVFTIAPFEIKQSDGPVFQETLKKLRTFGNPGDMWTGGVHRHEGRFMAGSTHSTEPHPFLDYSIVPITKYVDNRVQEKVEKNILNITKTFETLNSLTARYTNTANLLDFQEYKSLSYISDIDLSQDINGNVFGTFTVDKQSLLETETAFSFLIGNAKQAYGTDSAEYANFLDNITSLMTLVNMKILMGEEMIGSIGETQSESFSFHELEQNGIPSPALGNIKTIIQKNLFSLGTTQEEINKGSKGLQNVSFKHYNKSNGEGSFTYKVSAEYIDPTVTMVKKLKASVGLAAKQVDELINVVNITPPKNADGTRRSSGFNRATGKINDELVIQIKSASAQNPGFDLKVSFAPNKNGVLERVINMIESENQFFLTYFYSPEVDSANVKKYIYNLANINTTTLSQLLVLQQFLNHLNNKLGSDLDSFGSKPLKTTAPAPLETVQNSIEKSRGDKKITVESRENTIRVYDYGYDFTGMINPEQKPELDFEGRQTLGFLTISTNDFTKACLLSFSEVKSPNISVSDAINSDFKPRGLSQRTVKDSLYSYLNTPVSALPSCVLLPRTVSSNNISLNPMHYLSAVTKIKEYTLEDNTVGILGTNSPGIALKEDLISILSKDGASLPSVGQTEFTRTTTLQSKTTAPNGSFNQGSDTVAPANDLLSSKATINPGLDPISQNFKPGPKFTKQTNASNNDDISKNNLMSALVSRKNFSTIVNKPFKIEMSQDGFKPYPPSKANLEIGIKPPLQTVCLSLDPSADSPFKSFVNNASRAGGIPLYVKNGVVNPAMMAYYWFIHQNIVRVEYLSGYANTFNKANLKDKDNPYTPGKSKISFKRSVKTPKWRKLTSSVLDSLPADAKILCRIVRYEDHHYINRNLINEYEMPMINSQFILKKSLNSNNISQLLQQLASEAEATEGGISPEALGAVSQLLSSPPIVSFFNSQNDSEA